MKNLINLKVVGFGFIVYGVVFFILGNLGLAKELNGVWYAQILGCVGDGVACLVLNGNANVVKEIAKIGTPTIVDKPATLVEEPLRTISDSQFIDLQSLNHLAERFGEIGDVEGMKLCKDIQNKIFDLHHKVKGQSDAKV